MATMLDTELNLRFGSPKVVMTRQGEREVRNADPSDEFWTAWREDKEKLKREGYSLSKTDRGSWRVALWRETGAKAERAAAIEASRAADSDIEIPVPAGMEYLPFQKAGIAYAMAREGTLIADDMGLGKTIQAIGTANATGAKLILVICPASLLSNWRNEIKRWQTGGLDVYVVRAGMKVPKVKTGWVVINYDIVAKHPILKDMDWDLLVCDEAQYLKTRTAKRTKWILGCRANSKKKQEALEPIAADRVLMLTGTPIMNQPAEIFPLLHRLDPDRWSSMANFAKRYCGASFDGYGLQMGEPTNLDELQERLRSTVMVRRIKSEVLKELPPKRRQIVPLDLECADERVAAELQSEERIDAMVATATYAAQRAESEGTEAEYQAAVAALQEARKVAFAEMAKVRHDSAVAKIPAVIDHLLNTEGKVVIFCHHIDVVAALKDALEPHGVVVLTGSTPGEQRQVVVEQFQKNPAVRFFIGNMRAAGVGITLTASAHVVFAEADWVPATLSQCEDRCVRIGQINSVLVQHLVIDGSLDARMLKRVVEKQIAIDKALDTRHEAVEYEAEPEYSLVPDTDDDHAHAPRIRSKETPDIVLTAAQLQAMKSALRIVAGMDIDGAQALNGVGFSKFDTRFGKELAERDRFSPRQAQAGIKLIRKYRRQYPAALYSAMFPQQ